MTTPLDFEKPVTDLEAKIGELKTLIRHNPSLRLEGDIRKLEKKTSDLLVILYKNLTPWQKVCVARHSERPHTLAYIEGMCEEFTPLHGDRNFCEDAAIVGGLARFRGRSIVIMGHEKGHDVQTRITHNFGMAQPEGYKKARRFMEMAHRFSLPCVTLVDTAGAFPGREAEERGQASAIASCIQTSLSLETPSVAVIIGEGGSGGAVALACANEIFMLEHAVYSVISPEGAASILWRSGEHAKEAASSMRLTSKDLLDLDIIDGIIKEPPGGAHRHKGVIIESTANAIDQSLQALEKKSPDMLRQEREEKFLMMTQNS